MQLSNTKKKYKFVPKSKDNTLKYYNKEKIITRRKHHFYGFKSFFKKFASLYNLIFIPLLIAAAIAALYFVFFKTSFLKVTTVNVTGAKKYVSANDLNNLAKNKFEGQNILTVNTDDSQAVFSKTFLGAKSITISKDYPNKISIEVVERVPTALLYKDDPNQPFVIDSDGYVLGPAEASLNLPKIKYQGNLKVGTFIDEKLIPAYYELMSDLHDQHLNVSTISFYPKYLQLYVDNSTQVDISSEKNISDSLKLFGEVYKQLNVEGKKVNKIDLRYDKVIVSYD